MCEIRLMAILFSQNWHVEEGERDETAMSGETVADYN